MGHSVKQKVLHAGCGGEKLPSYLAGLDETRLDIDPSHNPDYVAGLTDLGEIGEYDVVFCCHTLEHVFQHEVERVLSEFKRVLKDGGAVMIIVPDLTDIPCDDTLQYESEAGPITGRDMYFGLGWYVGQNQYMAHKTGFTSDSLKKQLEEHFTSVKIMTPTSHDVLGIGVK